MLKFKEIKSAPANLLGIKILWSDVKSFEIVNTSDFLVIHLNKDFHNNLYQLLKISKNIKLTSADKYYFALQDFKNPLELQMLLEILFNNFYKKYSKKTNDNSEDIFVNVLGVFSEQQKKQILLLESTYLAKNLGDLDSLDEGTPQNFCKRVEENFQNVKNVKVEILNEKQIQCEGLNLLHAVGSSGKNKPRLLVVSYFNNKLSNKSTALIGKGVTFDAGGYALKDSTSIRTMRLDKCGGANVVGVIDYLTKSEAKVNVVGVIPLCENIVGENSILPSQVITSHFQKTVQVDNPDAEGRLILADAMSYAQSKFKIENVITLATLTGAITISLGKHLTGCFTNNQNLANDLIKACNQVGDEAWLMPIHQQDVETIRTAELGDITNSPLKKYASSSLAAAFLQEFVYEKSNFIHLDIGGTGVIDNRSTGVMVKGLINFLTNEQEGVFYGKK